MHMSMKRLLYTREQFFDILFLWNFCGKLRVSIAIR